MFLHLQKERKSHREPIHISEQQLDVHFEAWWRICDAVGLVIFFYRDGNLVRVQIFKNFLKYENWWSGTRSLHI